MAVIEHTPKVISTYSGPCNFHGFENKMKIKFELVCPRRHLFPSINTAQYLLTQFLCQLFGLDLFQLGDTGHRLVSHNTSSPMTTDLKTEMTMFNKLSPNSHKNKCCNLNYPKFEQCGFTIKDADAMANSVDPHQTSMSAPTCLSESSV